MCAHDWTFFSVYWVDPTRIEMSSTIKALSLIIIPAWSQGSECRRNEERYRDFSQDTKREDDRRSTVGGSELKAEHSESTMACHSRCCCGGQVGTQGWSLRGAASQAVGLCGPHTYVLQRCPTFWHLWKMGHTGRRVVLGHALNTQTLMKTDEQKKGFK